MPGASLGVETAIELSTTTHQARLSGGYGDLHHQGDLGQLMPEHVVQEHRLGLIGLHRQEVPAHSVELDPRGRQILGIRAHGNDRALYRDLAIQHSALPPSRTQRVEAHVARDAGRPRLQVAGARIGAPAERHYDLLEHRLHEIVVIDLAPAEDAKQRVIYDTEQTI